MWWQVVSAVGTLVVSPAGAVIAFAAFRRSARAEDARTSAEASKVGLEFMKAGVAEQKQAMEQALSHQQDVIREQQGQIGRLEGELKGCRDERSALAVRVGELEAKLS